MKGLEHYEGPLAGRNDADGLAAVLPPLGGPEHCHAALKRMADTWDCSGCSGGAMLLGPSGSGKSTAALHMLRRSLANHRWARNSRWVLASDLVEDEIAVKYAKSAYLLVLDDVGLDVAREEPRRAARLFRVLDHRYLRYPTIITSGLTYEMMRDHFDDATRRRMTEFRGRRVRVLSVHPKAERPGVLDQSRPPSDQAELERRYG